MLESAQLAKALVGAETNNSVRDVLNRVPGNEKAIAVEIAHEVGRVEAKLSVMLSHIEGHYESQVANLKLQITTQKFLVPALIGIFFLGALIGFAVGKIV